MPHYTKYYRYDAFFSHCSDDAGWYPTLFTNFPKSLGDAFTALTIIANRRITRDPSAGGPKIHASGRYVGGLAANGALFDPLYQDARDSFIFVAFIGNNYLINEACLTELLGFLESRRDPKALQGSLFLPCFPDVERKLLFDLASNPDLDGIADADQRGALVKLSTAVSNKLRELYGKPENLISMNIPELDPTGDRDPEEAAQSLARKFALWVAATLRTSSFVVDPERADDDCRDGHAYPLVVLRPARRPLASSADSAANQAGDPAAQQPDPAQQAFLALERLSRQNPGKNPLRAYPVPTEKLLHYADGTSVSPFDPMLPKAPMGVVMAREAVAAFAAPQASLLSKLSRNFGTLQISVAPPAPEDGVLAVSGENGVTLFEPEMTAKEFVQKLQSRYP